MMTLSDPHRRQLRRTSSPAGELAPATLPSLQSNRPPRTPPRFASLRYSLLAALLPALLLACTLPAMASLGGTVATIDADRARMNAKVQVMAHPAYTIHRMQAFGATVVDEYVSPQGQVFAVTWRGQFAPPMQQILGTYFSIYTDALNAQPTIYGHRPLNIQSQGLVVQTGGHMRAHFGRAYLPALVPQGIDIGRIQ